MNNLKTNKIMKQTAVEWLEKRLLGIVFLDTEYSTIEYEKRINQAKEMEKQQQGYSEEDMKLAFKAGHKKGFSGYPNTENWKELPLKEWFEQFKNK